MASSASFWLAPPGALSYICYIGRRGVGGIGIDLVWGFELVGFWGPGFGPQRASFSGYKSSIQCVRAQPQLLTHALSWPQSGSVEQSQRKVG